jgi:hypothetical protein
MEMQQPQSIIQPDIKTSPYMSPMHQYGSSIILMTNPENELFKLELTFRSMMLDANGNPYQVGEPLMNDYGISSVIGTIQALVNQITVMSNLDKFEVQMLMDFLADTLAKDLMMNRMNYDIKSSATRDKIYFNALATTFVTLKRGFEEGDKRFWKGSVQEIHTTMDTQRKKGILSALNPWSK